MLLTGLRTTLVAFLASLEVLATANTLHSASLSKKNVFVSRDQQDVQMRYITDSGVCETTPGVHQFSGYIDIGTNTSMASYFWFWFIESRKSPETAPFTLWINGGPGCSSMIGLLKEHGPCRVNEDLTTSINPYSWNEVSNVIYIDQPIGTGFSYGNATYTNTDSAAPQIWTAFQILFENPEFSSYRRREFIFASESYGGHYGPSFVTYFDQQNAKIQSGHIKGFPINVSTLMINNGWYDPLIQNGAYVNFTANAPGYGPIQNSTIIQSMTDAYYNTGGCKDQVLACYAAGTDDQSNQVCDAAATYCLYDVFAPAITNTDAYDLRQNASSLFPPRYYVSFLQQPDILKAIGAEVPYTDCSATVANIFAVTGDSARTQLPKLSALANSRLRILLWAGDADIICNWVGGHESALAMDWYGKHLLAKTPLRNMTVNGTAIAAIQNVDKFSFARVYGAGHAIPAFQPAAGFEIFRQIAAEEPLHSV